jgi:hypothetical protein
MGGAAGPAEAVAAGRAAVHPEERRQALGVEARAAQGAERELITELSGSSPIFKTTAWGELAATPMNLQHGILIRADTHTVSDVYAPIWNGHEIRKQLLLRDDEIVYRDIRSDSIVVAACGNVGKSGEQTSKEGFELFGQSYCGNALILPDEGRPSPKITPEEIAHLIRFVRLEPAGHLVLEAAADR